MLSELPHPILPIDLNVPEIDAVAVTGSVNLRLFINENGAVDRVDSSIIEATPDDYLALLKARFEAAQFVPGKIDGQAVKTQIRIIISSEALNKM